MNLIKTNFNPQIPLSKIEKFVIEDIGWEKGSFAIMLLMFSDREESIYIDYPTDMNTTQAEECLDIFSLNIKLFNTQNQPHSAVKADTIVNGGALQLALNVLRRAGKNEVADELEKTAERIVKITTTDKEILEKAAKAYGIPHVYCEIRGDMSHRDYATGWNPLWDQGDCDKLEAKLELIVVWFQNCVMVYKMNVCGHQEFFSNHKDKDFARRYAAVKMAANLA